MELVVWDKPGFCMFRGFSMNPAVDGELSIVDRLHRLDSNNGVWVHYPPGMILSAKKSSAGRLV